MFGALVALGLAIACMADYKAGAGSQHVTDTMWISSLGIHYKLAVTGLKERRPSPRVDNGQLTFTYEMADTLFIRLDGLKAVFGPLGAAAKSFRVTYADGLRLAFTGYLQKNAPENVTDGEAIVMGSGSITVTSLITITDTISNS